MRAMKKHLRNLVAAVAAAACVSVVMGAEDQPYKIYVDGKPITASVIETNGVIYAPVEAVGRALGADISLTGKEIKFTTKRSPAKTEETPLPTANNSPDEGVERTAKKVREFTFKDGKVTDFETMIWSYRNNEVDADNCYKNKFCRQKGTVVRIGKDADGSIYAMIAASNADAVSSLDLADAVKCYFPPSAAEAVATLSRHHRVVVRGICVGKVAIYPVMLCCHVEARLDDNSLRDPKDFGCGPATNMVPVSFVVPEPPKTPEPPTGFVAVKVTYYSVGANKVCADMGDGWLLTEDEAQQVRDKYGGTGLVLIPESADMSGSEFRRGYRSNAHSTLLAGNCYFSAKPGNYFLIVCSMNVLGPALRDRRGKYFFQQVSVKANETTKVSMEVGRGR